MSAEQDCAEKQLLIDSFSQRQQRFRLMGPGAIDGINQCRSGKTALHRVIPGPSRVRARRQHCG
jgi:hypothetical protein